MAMAFKTRTFMERFTNRFGNEVDSHVIVRKLEANKVISLGLLDQILRTNTGDGTLILYMHIRDNADLEALHKLCNVMIATTGHQQTEKLGRDMKAALPPLPVSETSDIEAFLNKTPTDPELLGVMNHIPDKWTQVAIDLEVPKAQVNAFKLGHDGGLDALAYWRDGRCKGRIPTTWRYLLEKITAQAGKRVADDVKRDVCAIKDWSRSGGTSEPHISDLNEPVSMDISIHPSDQKKSDIQSSLKSDVKTKPESNPGFEEIDAPKSTAPIDPTPQSGVPGDVHYVIMTANKNEWKSALHFLGVKCEVADKVKMQTFKDDDDLKNNVQEINPVFKMKGTGYRFFTVANKNAVLMKCEDMGGVASQQATVKLLDIAKEQGWSLEAIFIVGCCAAISEKNADSETGSVFVAKRIYYHGSGKLEDGAHKFKLEGYPVSSVQCDALEGLGSPTIKNIKTVSMLSGDLLVRDKDAAEDRRKGLGEKRIGFEMEGFGALRAIINLEQLQNPPKLPKVVLLKGVSDDASPDKNKSTSIMFFSEKMDDVDEVTRQQMCTIMSLTVALRAICEEYV